MKFQKDEVIVVEFFLYFLEESLVFRDSASFEAKICDPSFQICLEVVDKLVNEKRVKHRTTLKKTMLHFLLEVRFSELDLCLIRELLQLLKRKNLLSHWDEVRNQNIRKICRRILANIPSSFSKTNDHKYRDQILNNPGVEIKTLLNELDSSLRNIKDRLTT